MRRTLRIALVDHGVSAWNRWRANNPKEKLDFNGLDLNEIEFCGAHLSGVDLSSENFSEVNFSKAYLNETGLQGALLRHTDFSGAHLIEADFTGADLSGANLMHAYLMGANFTQANLTGANLSETTLRGTNFERANLTQVEFDKADLREASLPQANLNGARLHAAILSKITLNGNQLAQADLTGADVSGANLSGANLSGANLSGANLSGANLSGANLSGANLSGANLANANFGDADLRGANLLGANLQDVDFGGANLSGASFRGEDLWGTYPGEQPPACPVHATCQIFSMPAWKANINAAAGQANLAFSQADEPLMSVDNFEIAQVIYLLLNNAKLRTLIDTLTSKVVLILGRFTPERKPILEAMQDGLRQHGYLPVLVDFEKTGSRNFTEMIAALARLARFVLADCTDARKMLEEVPRLVQNLAVPVQPLLSDAAGEEPMLLSNLRKNYNILLETYRYLNPRSLLESFETQVIFPAEAKVRELGKI